MRNRLGPRLETAVSKVRLCCGGTLGCLVVVAAALWAAYLLRPTLLFSFEPDSGLRPEAPQPTRARPAPPISRRRNLGELISVTFKRLPSPSEGRKEVSITVRNNSAYYFEGTLGVVARDSDGDPIGRGEIDLSDGLTGGGTKRAELSFRTWRRVASLRYQRKGVFYETRPARSP